MPVDIQNAMLDEIILSSLLTMRKLRWAAFLAFLGLYITTSHPQAVLQNRSHASHGTYFFSVTRLVPLLLVPKLHLGMRYALRQAQCNLFERAGRRAHPALA